MSWGRKLRESFSPYEISLLWLAIVAIVTVAAVGLAFRTGPFGFVLCCFLLLPIGIAFEQWNRCPICGKSPMKRSKEGVGWFALYVMKYRYRMWPERECSECGHDLELIAE